MDLIFCEDLSCIFFSKSLYTLQKNISSLLVKPIFSVMKVIFIAFNLSKVILLSWLKVKFKFNNVRINKNLFIFICNYVGWIFVINFY